MSMSAKHSLLFLLMTVSSAMLSAQKISSQYLPPLTEQTPEFFKTFYRNDFPQGQNIFQLDAAADLHRQELKRSGNLKNVEEESTGEESEDRYLHYYKRWRRSIDHRITTDGYLMPDQQSQSRAKVYRQNSSRNAWGVIGPQQTFFKSQDVAGQPPSPWQINIYCCAIASSNTDVLYAGAETSGLYKTIDKGLHWNMTLDDREYYTSVVVDPSNSDVVYAGSNDKINKSTDGGATWTTSTFSCGDVNRIIIDPSNSSRLFAACQYGLFLSTDSGATWTLVSGMSFTTYDVFFRPNDPTTLYAPVKIGANIFFYKSVNSGVSFSLSMTGWTPISAASARMTVTPADPNRIYVAVLGDLAPADVPHIYRSDDAGQTWTLKCTGTTSFTGSSTFPFGMSNGQGYYDFAIAANPNNADQLIVATTSAYRSLNGATSFNPIGGYIGGYRIHPDIQDIAVSGSDTWIATDGGISYSSDFFSSSANFSTRINGLYGSDFWRFTQGWNEDFMAGGRYHNGNTVISENYPYERALRLGGAESPAGHYMIGRPRHIAFEDIGGVIVPDTFTGRTYPFPFGKYPNDDGYGFDASEVEFLPYCYNVLFLGNGNQFWRSVDGGVNWDSLYNFNDRVKKFEISRSNPDVIYLATQSRFYKSSDGGFTWTRLTMPSGINYYNLQITVDYNDADKVWITSPGNSTNNKVFRTVNGGSSWINYTTPTITGGSYRNIVHQAGTLGGVYILGVGGYVYYRNDTMTDWIDYSNQFPVGMNPLTSAMFYRDGKLRTAGNRGIWQVDFYEEGIPVAQPTVDKLFSDCPLDTFYFEDYSAVRHAGTTWSWNFAPAPDYISDSLSRNPKVVFGYPGTYNYTVTVNAAAGIDSKTITGKITVTTAGCPTAGMQESTGKKFSLLTCFPNPASDQLVVDVGYGFPALHGC
ncbi:MAG: hypothetical protein RIQ47_274, partial [Bacteroidota bacterium]